jgi:hypothetical protein
LKNPLQKRAGGVAQGVGPEFKPQYCKKNSMLFCVFSLSDEYQNQLVRPDVVWILSVPSRPFVEGFLPRVVLFGEVVEPLGDGA